MQLAGMVADEEREEAITTISFDYAYFNDKLGQMTKEEYKRMKEEYKALKAAKKAKKPKSEWRPAKINLINANGDVQLLFHDENGKLIEDAPVAIHANKRH